MSLARKEGGGRGCHFGIRHLIQVRDELHVMVALTPEKEPGSHFKLFKTMLC
jgi:hypothetical protein